MMEEDVKLDENLLKKLNRLSASWPEHRRDLTCMIYFSLAFIALIFISIDKFDLVATSPVVKVIDVFGLLLLFIVPVWAYYERTQGDNLHRLLKGINEGDYDPGDATQVELISEAAEYSGIAERGYPFMLMMTGVGIYTLNVIAYIVFGPAPV